MSQSTPINMIRRNGTSDGGSQISIPDMGNMDPMSSDSQLVEDILKEMGDSPGAELQSNINYPYFFIASRPMPLFITNGIAGNRTPAAKAPSPIDVTSSRYSSRNS